MTCGYYNYQMYIRDPEEGGGGGGGDTLIT